jgi:hypothetical protein
VPINTVTGYIKDLLDGITPPGDTGLSGPLVALVTPYDPDVSGEARAYVWPSTGAENRRAMPRNTGMNTPAGWKNLRHSVDIFLTWFDSDSDPDADVNFPALIDYVMDVLRTSACDEVAYDPETGRPSHLINVGETMNYEYVPPMSMEDERYLRYDAKIMVSVLELFQA